MIVTEWREFRSPNFETLKAKLKSPVIFDGRNLYDPAQVRGLGFEYLAFDESREAKSNVVENFSQ